jgi:cbb3-type cytochrome oxidase cytochrome c subunit
LDIQAGAIAADLMKEKEIQQIMEFEGVKELRYTKMVALIAYLQRIGTDIKTVSADAKPVH